MLVALPNGCRRESTPTTAPQPSTPNEKEHAVSGEESTSASGIGTAEPSAARQPSAAVAGARQGGASNDGTYYVAYTPKPDPIPLNEMFELTVWVSAANDRGTPLRDVQLSADAAMPEHDHGMNTTPKVKANPDGSFTVNGMLFHMPGYWELYLDVTRGGITERAQFDVQLE